MNRNKSNKSTKSGSRPGRSVKTAKKPMNRNQGRSVRSNIRSFNQPTAAAVAYSTGVHVSKPLVNYKREGGALMCSIKHKEFIGNLSGAATTAFTQALSLALNPGIAATFPWLANIAQNWQSYRFKNIVFRYFTRTATTTLGSVILVPDYSASDGAAISEQTADSYEDAQEDAPWKNIECRLSPNAMHILGPKKFIRLGPVASTDIKTYDAGNMFVFTVDSVAAASWGKLWVEYDVDLFVPQLPPGGSSFTQTMIGYATAGMTAAEPLGSAQTNTGNMQAVTGNNGTNSTIVISNAIVGGEYSLSIYTIGTVITTAPTIQTYTGAAVKTGNSGFPAAATSGFSFDTFTASASTVTLVIYGVATTITSCVYVLALVPTNVV